jgi:hypothetical protein
MLNLMNVFKVLVFLLRALVYLSRRGRGRRGVKMKETGKDGGRASGRKTAYNRWVVY